MSEDSKDKPKQKQIKLQIKMRDEMASGRYANMTIVHHNDSEFIMDFLFVQPQTPRGEVTSRVVMSPLNLKRTIRLLQERLSHYEERFGEIEIPSTPVPPEGMYH